MSDLEVVLVLVLNGMTLQPALRSFVDPGEVERCCEGGNGCPAGGCERGLGLCPVTEDGGGDLGAGLAMETTRWWLTPDIDLQTVYIMIRNPKL